MIKPITTSPVARKTFVGAMLVASLLNGAAASSQSIYKGNGVNRRSEVEQVSYEENYSLIDRLRRGDSEDYSELGLYYGSIIGQHKADFNKATFMVPHASEVLREGITRSIDEKDIAEVKEFNKWRKGFLDALTNYRDQTLAQAAQALYNKSSGVPTAGECSNYLDRKLAGLNMPMADYEKCMEEIADFQEAQGKQTSQDFAELIAYKQFKCDSVNIRRIAEDFGALDNPTFRKEFEREWPLKVRPNP